MARKFQRCFSKNLQLQILNTLLDNLIRSDLQKVID
jgi:hypothetical protein